MEASPAGDEALGLFLVFQLDERLYGIPVTRVREILPLMEITPVPNPPPFISGVFNLRGAIVPVIALRRQLGLPERPPDFRTCLVVVQGIERSYGLIVDRVFDCLEISSVSHPPEALGGLPAERPYVHSIGQHEGRIVILLDAEKLLSAEEWKVVASL